MTVEAAVSAAKREQATREPLQGAVTAIGEVFFLFVILFLFAFPIRLRPRQTPNPVAR